MKLKTQLSFLIGTLTLSLSMNAKAQLFEKEEPLRFEIHYSASKLSELKEKASSQSERESMAARMVYEGVEIPIELSVKGMSSPAELEFPKIKIDIDKSVLANEAVLKRTPFGKDNEFSVQTHGFNQDRNGEWTHLGRLRHSKWVFREASIYRLLAHLGVPVRSTRSAFITYVSENGKLENKPALLQEKMSKLAKKLGGSKVKNLPFLYVEDKSVSQPELIKQDVAAGRLVYSEVIFVELMNVMIGNADFDFPTLIEPDLSVQNFNILKVPAPHLPGKEKIILSPEDFDMASVVTGLYRTDKHCDIPEEIQIAKSPAQEKVWCQIQQLCFSHRAKDMQSALHQILKLEPKAVSFNDPRLDEEGRKLLATQVKSFFTVAKKIQIQGSEEAICEWPNSN